MTDRALMARESAISAVINGVLSLLFFLLVFGLRTPVALQNLALDSLPQSFMVAFMGSLVPGLIVAGRRQRARYPVVVRAVLIGVACLAILGGGGWLVLRGASGTVAAAPVLLAKVLYGAALGAAITPFAVHRVLRQEPLA